MAKYQKLPVVIEAVRWYGKYSDGTEWPDWFRTAIDQGVIYPDAVTMEPQQSLTIKTLEGNYRADVGDYIIQGIRGELYPCNPDIFEATYRAV